ncbi:MAG: hypothetical protein GVX78_01220 [Bacteroidetes bacterium]|jgi:hypothetical protein|nr:hypothetical protein [Bacteroidota bacterium]
MGDLFLALLLASIVALIIGLVKPDSFSRVLGSYATRKGTATIFGIAFVVFFILFGVAAEPSEETLESESTTEATVEESSQNDFVNTGEEGVVNMTPEHCEDSTLIAPNREAFEAFHEARATQDGDEIQNVMIRENVFGVFDCTKVEVIDSAGFLGSVRQVRVLEGGNEGKTGWVPVEWVQHEAPEREEAVINIELPEYEVLDKIRGAVGGYSGDVLIQGDDPLSIAPEDMFEIATNIAEKENFARSTSFYTTEDAYKTNVTIYLSEEDRELHQQLGTEIEDNQEYKTPEQLEAYMNEGYIGRLEDGTMTFSSDTVYYNRHQAAIENMNNVEVY